MTADLQPSDWGRLPIGGSAIQSRIADAAIELFYARGAVATTVREITGACGLTPGALYNHFSSKDYLLYVLVRDVHLQVSEQIAGVLASAEASPADQLAAMVRFLVSHTAGSKKQSRVANREYSLLTGDHRTEVRQIRRQIRDYFTGPLVAGAEQGIFALPGGTGLEAAQLAAATISNMCVHISQSTLETYRLGAAELEERYALMALRLAGASPTGTHPAGTGQAGAFSGHS
jgi:TetR/AcrR family transcriptional regulator, cholesterol catabolism regulator